MGSEEVGSTNVAGVTHPGKHASAEDVKEASKYVKMWDEVCKLVKRRTRAL